MERITIHSAGHTPGIYGLVDPREPNRVRYIGSASSIQKRLKTHAKGYVPRHADGPKVRWLYKLMRDGRAPVALVLEVGDWPHQSPDRHAAERRWIAVYRLVGEADLNVALTKKGYGELAYLREKAKRLESELAEIRKKQECNTTLSATLHQLQCCDAVRAATQHTGGLGTPVLRCTGSGSDVAEGAEKSTLDIEALAEQWLANFSKYAPRVPQ